MRREIQGAKTFTNNFDSCRLTRLRDSETETITCLLKTWGEGDESAEEKLWSVVYDEMRRMARRYLRGERPEHTLQTTALVHEVYLKFVDQRQVRYKDRNHFYAIAARIMRRILVDHARQRATAKRGGDYQKVKIITAADSPVPSIPEVVAVDEALMSLEKLDPLKASVVELRFYGGLTHSEIAEVLECSEMTVRRHWQVAQAWLRRELADTWE